MKLNLTIFFFIYSLTCFSQYSHKIFKEDTTQKTIINATKEFDRLVFVDYASYWGDDKEVNGIGFKETEVYYVSLTFEKIKELPGYYRCSESSKIKIENNEQINACFKLNLDSIMKIEKDSIQIYSKPGSESFLSVSDCTHYTLFVVEQLNGKFYLKQTYCPRIYQREIYTQDREYLMEVSTKISNILKENK